jgi:indolepyruvate ferredoxin oxidoreductase alpha subunit
VAFDASTRASFSGARSIAIMKHVGFNVVADSLQQLNLIGIAGRFALVYMDDPSGVSSSNEQDNRSYAKFAGLPAIESADLKEPREMAKRTFEISEELHMPVILRSVTRLGHMTGDLELGKTEPKGQEPYFDSSRQWTPFPCLEPERRVRQMLRHTGRSWSAISSISTRGGGARRSVSSGQASPSTMYRRRSTYWGCGKRWRF